MVEAVVVGNHKVCRGEEGQRALEQLEARLACAAGIAQPVRLEVVDRKMVNALTLPGARMVIMSDARYQFWFCRCVVAGWATRGIVI